MIDATHTTMGLTLMSYTNGDDPALDAEIDGAIARRRGEPLNANPYGYTPQSDNWEAGWIEEDKWLRFPDGPIYYGKPNYPVPAIRTAIEIFPDRVILAEIGIRWRYLADAIQPSSLDWQ